MSDPAVIDALREALERDPKNGPLWLHLADLLVAAARADEARTALRTAIEAGADRHAATLRLLPLLRAAGETAEAVIRAEAVLEDRDDPALRMELARILLARGSAEEARAEYAQACAADASLRDIAFDAALDGGPAPTADPTPPPAVPAAAAETPAAQPPPAEPDAGRDAVPMEVVPEGADLDDWASQFDWGDLRVTFEDVAGLDDVKRQIHLRIVAPFKNPEVYRAFRRSGGGGILLYGPPGCGKTYVARATAGEVGAQFVAVGIHEILDRWWGESEKAIHALFEEARRRRPCIIFFDEFDALGSSRASGESQFWKTLVDQLLQEMDGVGGRNEDVLVFASTNAPWNVDAAFRRPGRFDRLLFVPPPDESARQQILQRGIQSLPGGDTIAVAALARATALMTGADLTALCERAAEHALSRSLEQGAVQPVTQDDFERELKALRSSAGEWIATARNYARYSNEGGQYDELSAFLKRIKKW